MSDELEGIPGIGPATLHRLERLGITNPQELLYHFPRRYLDRSCVTPAADVSDGAWVTVRGRIDRARTHRSRRPGLLVAEAVLKDDTGAVGLVWFLSGRAGGRQIKAPVTVGQPIIASGTVKMTGRGPQMQSPEWEEDNPQSSRDDAPVPIPLYPLTDGLSQAKLRRWIAWVLAHACIEEYLPESLPDRNGLLSRAEAFRRIHAPRSIAEVEDGRRRLAFDELLAFQLHSLETRRKRRRRAVIPCPEAALPPKEFKEALPFVVTASQAKAIDVCSLDIQRERPMRRLLQGDVGAGKTVVAAYVAARAVLAGNQAALMAPTRLLAKQHVRTLRELLAPWGIEVVLLVSNLQPEARAAVAARLAAGDPLLVVGTHALLREDLDFSRLAVGIVDEQHRFGVAQREAFESKGAAHLLVMSATPIPRTLALVLYADLDVSSLGEKPPGRPAVDTRWIHPRDRQRVYSFVRREVKRGRQAYVVFPRVNSDGDEAEGGAEEEAERLSADWLAGIPVGLLHGQMAAWEQEGVMESFVAGETRVLIATTVVEVGVDVPNASVMVVEGAERFGLAQLHQLRGRIGRGGHEGYFLLLTDSRTEQAKIRIDALRKTDDGFKIAELDLTLRGPGQLTGVRQTGPSEFKAVDLTKDMDLLQTAGVKAELMLGQDHAVRARSR